MRRAASSLRCLLPALLLLCLCSAAAPTWAGSQATSSTQHAPEQLRQFAKKLEKTLAQKGAKVAIVARLGYAREQLPAGIRYTHIGFAVYSQIITADGRKLPGYAMYNLYQTAEDRSRSQLAKDFPIDFFAAASELEAGVLIPTPALQQRLLQVLSSDTYQRLHNPRYSVIANPFNREFQNCTEHTLDVLMAAIYQTDDIQQIKANERAYFQPQTLNISPLKLLLGSVFAADVALADHPNEQIQTATFGSIQRFLQRFNALSETLVLTP